MKIDLLLLFNVVSYEYREPYVIVDVDDDDDDDDDDNDGDDDDDDGDDDVDGDDDYGDDNGDIIVIRHLCIFYIKISMIYEVFNSINGVA